MRSRPGQRPTDQGGECQSGDLDGITIPPGTDRTGLLPAYVVLLRTSDQRTRRQVCLSLHSAERALSRAARRGHDAELVLCRLEPVTQPAPASIEVHAATVAEQLRRRREGSLRLPPLANGRRDPLDVRHGGR